MTDSVDPMNFELVTRDRLIEQWVALFGQPPPPKTGQALMTRLIAHEQQARAEGGLSPALRRRLSELATGRSSSRTLSPGSQLIREWNGEQHVVDVEEGGFRWKDRVFRSLSSVAEAITGAKWSGPRFFGLRQ